MNTLKLKITEGPLLLNLNQVIVATGCLLYVQANSIDQVINMLIHEKYYALTYISTLSAPTGCVACLSSQPAGHTLNSCFTYKMILELDI